MSLYNLVHGTNPFAAILLNILGTTFSDVPRFRDCFLDEEGRIVIYTRTGGGNRAEYESCEGPNNMALRRLPGFIDDEDDDFDTTYASFRYNVDERLKPRLEAFSKLGAVRNPAEMWKHLFEQLKSDVQDSPAKERLILAMEPVIDQLNEILEEGEAMKLFEYAVLYTPIQTKDQAERGEKPKTELIVDVKRVIANSEKEAMMLAARDIPTTFSDKLECVEIAMRPF